MEGAKSLPWLVFVGCILTMVSLFVAFGINTYLMGQSSDIYRSRPLANLAGAGLLILGIILIYLGFRKAE
jgi:putative Ca2+/H+ antiporter (TMEM165/GDT1 family)